MELRKKVKRPQRYEPEIDDAGRAERYIPPLNRPIFSTPFVEYNPSLPAAAFPTLSQVQIVPSEQNHATEASRTKSGQQAATISIAERTLSQTNTAKSRTPSRTEPRRGHIPASAVEDENLAASNCDQNPVYTSNLQLSQMGSQRTEHDWNIQEMETSDEEELQEETMSTTTVGSTPAWEELTVALRLEIVSTLAEYSSRREAVQRLQLSVAQRREVVSQLARRDQHEVTESETIAKFQRGLVESLLAEQASPSSKLTAEVYRELLEEHLKSAGLAPWLGGHWVEASPFTSSSYAPPSTDGRALFVQNGGVRQHSVQRQQQALPVRRRIGDMEGFNNKGAQTVGAVTRNAQPFHGHNLPGASGEQAQASPQKK